MKTKNQLIRISTIIFVLLASIILAACNPPAKGPTVGGGGNTIPDPGQNPGPSVSEPDPKTPISDLFSRYKVITTGQDVTIADPTTGTIKQFNELLDRQIDVLATDILYRLSVVYGNGYNTTDVLFNLSPSYSYSGDNAEVDGKNIILPQINGDYYSESYQRIGTLESMSPIIDDAGYFAHALRGGYWSEPISGFFNNTHTIAGGHFWDVDSEKFDSDLGLNTSYAWNWNYTGTGIDHTSTNKVFENYINAYKENLKSAIAQILASPENATPNINYHNDYKNYLNDINYLGFTAGDRQKIENFVLNEVIGTYNINSDEAIYNSVVSVLGGNVLSPSTINETFLETEELHYYKAYKTLVPKMLERAFSNTFGGKEVNRIVYDNLGNPVKNEQGKVQYSSLDELENIETVNGEKFVTLYPKMTRSQDIDLNIKQQDPNTSDAPEFLMLGLHKEVKSVILQPKQGSYVSGLFMAVSGEDGVRFDFKVNVKYVAKGVEHANGYVSQLITGTQTSEIFTVAGKYDTSYGEGYEEMPYYFALDISSLIKTKPYPTFNNYNGINSGNQNLWNNPYSFDGYKLAGDNYLEISFEIINATKNNMAYNGEVKFDIGFADPY